MTYIKEVIMYRRYSFIHPVNGLKIAFHETNIKIQLAIASVLTTLGLFVGYSKWEWICTIIYAGLAISLEIVNTSIEHRYDFTYLQYHCKIKDLAASSVLVAAIAAFGIAIIMLTLST